MLRTIIVRRELIKETLEKAARLNLARTLSVESTRRRHRCNRPSFLQPNLKAPCQPNYMRFLTTLPPHTKVMLPALSPTMDSGTIIMWEKKEGDKLNEGDLLCEIETDKATMGFETPEEGYLAKIIIPAGTKDVKIGALVCIIVNDEKDVVVFKHFKADASQESVPVASVPVAPITPDGSVPAPRFGGLSSSLRSSPVSRVFASPYAKKLAAEGNIQLQGKGSGPYDSITSKDLEKMPSMAASAESGRKSMMAKGLAAKHQLRSTGAAPAPVAVATPAVAAAPTAHAPSAHAPSAHAPSAHAPSAHAPATHVPATPGAGYVDTPLTKMREVIAKRLLESKSTIPHYYLTAHCNVDKLLAMRAKFNKQLAKDNLKVSVNDFIIKGVACATIKVPEANSAWMGTFIRQYSNVDVSMAVSTPTGLITPIIFNANGKGIVQISKDAKALAEKARAGKLQPAEFQGGTISISNLGMFGTSQFFAIINPPQSVIVAIGTNETRLIPCDKSEKGFRAAQYMTVSLSCDHRVIDGAQAAKWLKALREFMEDPEKMIM